tara:strand:+ start:3406 stop:3900 length:495 start_codon:yes stop_codon:yes gene_type:complete
LKHVTNEEFEKEYNNQDNRNIIKAVTKKYSKSLSKDDQKSCGMHGLWRCIQNHDDSYGRKFTTSLFIHVEWECRRHLSSSKKNKVSFLGEMDSEIVSSIGDKDILDILETLPENQKDIIYQRFYENRTLEEIGKSQGYSKEAARQNINKIISKLRESCRETFGV